MEQGTDLPEFKDGDDSAAGPPAGETAVASTTFNSTVATHDSRKRPKQRHGPRVPLRLDTPSDEEQGSVTGTYFSSPAVAGVKPARRTRKEVKAQLSADEDDDGTATIALAAAAAATNAQKAQGTGLARD